MLPMLFMAANFLDLMIVGALLTVEYIGSAGSLFIFLILYKGLKRVVYSYLNFLLTFASNSFNQDSFVSKLCHFVKKHAN